MSEARDEAGARDPQPADYFVRASAIGLLRRGHPYDFVETYDILQRAYGYRSHFVNLGLWRADLVAGGRDLDPAQRLVRFLCTKSGVASARSILDVGSGLGEGALELARFFHAERVVGINVNERQLAFANALARSRADARVTHVRADACSDLAKVVKAESVDAAFAVECVGHFHEPERFLAALRAALRPGGVFVCCMNVATGDLPLSFRAMLRATYGFVPRALSSWLALVERAGLEVVERGDLTDAVLADGARAVLANLDDADVPWAARALVRRQLAVTQRALAQRRLGYAWLTARRPPSASS